MFYFILLLVIVLNSPKESLASQSEHSYVVDECPVRAKTNQAVMLDFQVLLLAPGMRWPHPVDHNTTGKEHPRRIFRPPERVLDWIES